MKISIAWVFDHIDADWKNITISDLVARFNHTTAEIEHYKRIDSNLSLMSLGQVIASDAQSVTVHSLEWKKDFVLPPRADAIQGQWHLIKKQSALEMRQDLGEQPDVVWATGFDFHCAKDHVLPALSCSQELCDGGWKKHVEAQDYILEIDNKSITHRPDLWGHRGMAREIAALFDLPLKPLSQFLEELPIKSFDTSVSQSSSTPFAVAIKDPKACKRFAGLYIASVENQSSLIPMALRLLKVDSKPISMLVDMTNYVMLDLSQPMHAFDAAKIPSKTIVARRAHGQEKLALLDGQTIELLSEDLVIADDAKPLGLAGIMGGAATAITVQTNALFLESACFDATTIRHASVRHRLRTDASARFEKSLDPNQNVTAIERFVKLLSDAHVKIRGMSDLVSLGAVHPEIMITITHDFLEKKLGVALKPEFVTGTLEKLGCTVVQHDGSYQCTIPSWRSTKDITSKEDILEEIGRFYGYTNIKPVVPYKKAEPSDLNPVYRVRTLKNHLAYALEMHEISSYALYDEHFLREIGFEPIDFITVRNPVSEHWKRLVTSLIPHQLKALDQNKADYDSMRFFEWACTWKMTDPSLERKVLAGIFYEKKKTIDFYQIKNFLQSLFHVIHLDVKWEQVSAPADPWYAPYQTARLSYDGMTIGTMGKMHSLFLNKLVEGEAFIFELDAEFLLTYKPMVTTFKSLPKYPDAVRDISLLVPLHITADEITHKISHVSDAIVDVELVDFFEKREWKDQRSLTYRFVIRDESKTLTKSDVDMVYDMVMNELKNLGATIR